MARTQRTTEQIIGLLVEDEVKLSQGVTVGGFKLQCATHYRLSAYNQSGQSSTKQGASILAKLHNTSHSALVRRLLYHGKIS